VLIYGILFVSEVLGKVKPGMGRREAEKVCRLFFTSEHRFAVVFGNL
jgi:hypothetical protein